jgi:hypothetical protein
MKVMNAANDILKQQGAVIVDPADIRVWSIRT